MKMMKLLGAASVAALMAGAAHAQLDLVQVSTGGEDFAAPIVLAEEIDFAALSDPTTGDSAIFGLEVLTQGQIPPGQNILLTVDVSGGVFPTALVDGTTYVVGGETGAVVQSGGAAGASSVQFLITTDASDTSIFGGGTDSIALEIPITVPACGDVTFSVSQFETEVGGNAIEGGTAVLSDGAGTPVDAITCDDAFVATLVPDAAVSTVDFAGTFTSFVVAGPDTVGTAVLGDFNLAIDATNLVSLTPGDVADESQVTGFDVSIDFADVSGIEDGTATATAGSIFADADVAPTGTSIVLSSTATATANPSTGTFDIDAEGTDPIMAQAVTASGGTISLTDTYLQATDAFTAQDVEDLIFNGSTFGPFDWVADTSGRVNSIFRVTGLDTLTSDIPALLIVENARNGASFNGVYPFTVMASDVQGSEIRYVSSTLEGIAGAFGTADVTMVFGDTLDLDVDRLLSGPSTATVVPFGDGANQDGTGVDATTRATTENDDEGNF
jgi:hypothetical protein